MKALVIGGSGPTGPHIVEGLRRRGSKVTVLNRGVHPVPFPDDVEQVVADPHFAEPLQQALGGRTFDVAVATYGRLKFTAEVLKGRTGQFIAIGGTGAYRGCYEPSANWPFGNLLPVREAGPLAGPGDNRFEALVAATERTLFELQPAATLFRYPYVYGPRQLVPREWSLVRRVLDGRRTILLMHGGLGLMAHIYAENAAHAVLLAVDHPEAAAGKTYNIADDEQIDQRQLVQIGARALGVEIEILSLPDVASIQGVLISEARSNFLVDTSRVRAELGYRDVTPTIEAVTRTMQWYRDHPLERGGEYEQRRKDVFDYEAEDRLIALCRDFQENVRAIELKPLHDTYAPHPYAHPKAQLAGRDERGR